MIRDQNVASKAAVAYLGARKEVANCGLHFRGFKRKNTLRSLNITLKNSKKKLQGRYLDVSKQEACTSNAFRI